MQETKSETPLNCELKSYSVLCLSAVVLDDKTVEKGLRVDPNVRFDIGKSEYKAFVHCTYTVSGFDFICGIEGSFVYREPISNDNVVNAWYNACTMLYGIMRGIYTSSVAQATHEVRFLPAVMMIGEIRRKLNALVEAQKASESKTERSIPPPQS